MTYEWKNTWLSEVNPSLKLIITICFFILVIFIHNPNTLLLIVVFSFLLLFFYSGHPLLFLLLYCAPFLLLFVSSSSAMMLFGKGDTTWFQYGIIHITEESFFRGIHLGMRATVFAVLGLLFALTTKPVRLFYSLMQQLKFPTNLAYSFMASIRMLPIMVSEFQTLVYAYEIRGLNKDKGISSFYKKLIFFSIPLLAQAIRRAQRIAIAMEAKQFKSSGRRSHFYHIGFGKNDLYFVSVVGILIMLSSWIGQLEWFIPVSDVRYFEASM